MRRLAATILVSAALTGGLAAGSGTASAAGSFDAAESSEQQLSPPVAEILSGIVRFVAMDVLGSSEVGIGGGIQ
ncbi:hypothetical protein [Rhodococcus sp. MTM3W5.2]|uniref:hypothetical protein n=1 Tax=Rhodococcus sp. MTM3W5.2 TaxID=1805827 RepID=UPI0011AE48D6|nr:hypothetical protein [Rhodococcus sp. MTM3W5.2]